MKTHWLYEESHKPVGGATEMASSQDQDTEITLGTGRMLAIFFALVALCAVCFGFGYSMGRNSFKPDVAQAATQDASGVKPGNAKTKPAKATETGLTFFETVKQNEGDAPANPAPSPDAQASKPAADSPNANNPNAVQQPSQLTGVLGASGYMVQVAAVSKKEDADALVAALQKKNYVVVVAGNEPYDQLFHVQVGPFSDIKDAETVRAKLVGDGYNPILKK